jgi:hypothetical protein
MPTNDLPGMNRLLETARRHGVPLETLPAGRSPPKAGEQLYGMPVDPLLAAAFARCGKLFLGSGSTQWAMLTRCDDEVNGLLLENKEWQDYFPHDSWPEHFRVLMLFGNELLYRYATVPELSNSAGRQPVIRVDPYEDIHALPVASDLDRFFDAYSRYLEIAVRSPESQATGVSWVRFPHGVPEIIASDRPLVDMIKQGRFDRWMYERDKTGRVNAADHEGTRAWINEVLQSIEVCGSGSLKHLEDLQLLMLKVRMA